MWLGNDHHHSSDHLSEFSCDTLGYVQKFDFKVEKEVPQEKYEGKNITTRHHDSEKIRCVRIATRIKGDELTSITRIFIDISID